MDERVKQGMKSSEKQDWSTPQVFVDAVGRHLNVGGFDLDVCAASENAKAPSWYTEADDGLQQPWYGAVWCNPPYAEVEAWFNKANHEILRGGTWSTRRLEGIVMLVPARTDTSWFHDVALKCASQVIFIKHRIYFQGGDAANERGGALFPSMLIVMDGKEDRPIQWSTWSPSVTERGR